MKRIVLSWQKQKWKKRTRKTSVIIAWESENQFVEVFIRAAPYNRLDEDFSDEEQIFVNMKSFLHFLAPFSSLLAPRARSVFQTVGPQMVTSYGTTMSQQSLNYNFNLN